MIISALLAFWGLSALLALTPGADWAYVISASLHRRGPAAVIGILTAQTLAAIAVVCGLAAVIAGSPVLFTAITVLGGAYLVWLGIRALLAERPFVPRRRERVAQHAAARQSVTSASAGGTVQTSGEGAAASAGDAGDGLEDGVEAGTGERGEQATQQSWSSAFLGGTLVSLLNPKVILLFLALLPQFTREPGDSDLWPLWAQMGVLSAAHLLNCALVYVAVSAGFGRLLLHRPAARHWVSLASGAIMLILGLVVVIGELFA